MRIWHVAAKDLLQVLRDRMSALFLVAMPIAFTFFIGIVFDFGGGEEAIPLGLAMEDDPAHPATGVLVELLRRSGSLRVVPVEGDGARAALEGRVGSGALAGGVVVPAGFGEALLAGEELPLDLLVDAGSAPGEAAESAVRATVARLATIAEAARLSVSTYEERAAFPDAAARREYAAEALERALAASEEPAVRIRSEGSGPAGEEAGAPSGFEQSSPGILVQFVVFGVITTATLLVVERTSGTLRRTLAAPIRRAEVIAGHLAAMFIVVAAQQAILVLFGQFALGVSYFSAPLAVAVMAAALGLFGASFGLFLGAVSRSEDQVVMYSLIAMFLLSGLGGAWFPLDVTGPTFSRVGHLLPTAWAMDGFQNVIVRGLGLSSVLLPAAIVAAWGAATFGLAVWRLRPQ